ncbi:hypothetical protein [Albimonas pacifica]|uniref:Uncharacterized protein n=1 Tax=Albimonas pacifica TaxID=1114924 RepID=A0A1I3MPI4_9RHOB|nr:hypothetical protein [Albimonas pacifica]SFI98720.1 hypothetical protein SAMN05216258_111187 [Albimonas pacifica]
MPRPHRAPRALRLALPALLLAGLAAPAAAEPVRLGMDIETEAPILTAFALDSSCASAGLPSATLSATPRLGRVDTRAVVATVPEGPCAGQEVEGAAFVFHAFSQRGEETFTLTVENATVGGGAHDVEVNVRD